MNNPHHGEFNLPHGINVFVDEFGAGRVQHRLDAKIEYNPEHPAHDGHQAQRAKEIHNAIMHGVTQCILLQAQHGVDITTPEYMESVKYMIPKLSSALEGVSCYDS
jgi:hypothetical protein